MVALRSVLLISTSVLLFAPAVAQADNFYENPGFEDGLNGWITFANVFHETTNPPQFVPFEGEGLVSMFGPFDGSVVSGLFQEFPASEGDEFTLDVYSRQWSGDALAGDNFAVQKIVFKDAADVEIGAVESVIMDATFTPDVWHDNDPIMGVAPPNTVQVEAFFLFVQPAFDGGAVHLDNAVFTPEPSSLLLLSTLGVLALRRR